MLESYGVVIHWLTISGMNLSIFLSIYFNTYQRFGIICYFFEQTKSKFAHICWYQHGSQTLLQECAHDNGLFLTDECDDVPLESIYSHCNIFKLSPTDDQACIAPTNGNIFFTGYVCGQICIVIF